jgi:GrpB-like predicted nucleotidyltransferase (UPF0157 family)
MPETRKIIIESYNANWKKLYKDESNLLRVIFSHILLRIEHIGSTSIPNMASKPIIDILIEVKSLMETDKLNNKMKQIGYIAKGENGIPGRRYFRKGTDLFHTHHIHVYQQGDPNISKHILFRNYLIDNVNKALEYQSLKIKLAEEYREDPISYTEGKAVFTEQMLREANNWENEKKKEGT